MNWLADLATTVGWVVGVGGGITGTILGIRAERRATHYNPHWVVTGPPHMSFTNRTGEDATNITVHVTGDGHIANRKPGQPWGTDHLTPGEKLELYFIPDKKPGPVTVDLRWTRPTNGRTYELGEKPRQRWIRWARESRARRKGGTPPLPPS